MLWDGLHSTAGGSTLEGAIVLEEKNRMRRKILVEKKNEKRNVKETANLQNAAGLERDPFDWPWDKVAAVDAGDGWW